MKSFTLIGAVAGFIGLSAAGIGPAASQTTWPMRTVNVIVPWQAGGGSDTLARTIFEPLAARLGQAFPLTFRPGAAGTIGTSEVARNSEPDGYTLLFTSGPPIVAANFMTHVPYKPQGDLIAVLECAFGTNALVANATTPYNTFQEFVDYAKAHPGDVSVGAGGIGSNGHYIAASTQFKTGAKFNFVPYNGVADQLADLMGGTLNVGIGNGSGYQPGIDAGKLKFLATMAPERNPALPNVPSSDESDYKGIQKTNWYGIFVPKGTPPEIVEAINAEVNTTLLDPAVTAKLATQGFLAVAKGTPADFTAMIEEEVQDTRQLIDAGAFSVGE